MDILQLRERLNDLVYRQREDIVNHTVFICDLAAFMLTIPSTHLNSRANHVISFKDGTYHRLTKDDFEDYKYLRIRFFQYGGVFHSASHEYANRFVLIVHNTKKEIILHAWITGYFDPKESKYTGWGVDDNDHYLPAEDATWIVPGTWIDEISTVLKSEKEKQEQQEAEILQTTITSLERRLKL